FRCTECDPLCWPLYECGRVRLCDLGPKQCQLHPSFRNKRLLVLLLEGCMSTIISSSGDQKLYGKNLYRLYTPLGIPHTVPYVWAYRSAAMTISGANYITWDAKVADTGNFFRGSTATYLYAPGAGTYLVSISVATLYTGGDHEIRMIVNTSDGYNPII